MNEKKKQYYSCSAAIDIFVTSLLFSRHSLHCAPHPQRRTWPLCMQDSRRPLAPPRWVPQLHPACQMRLALCPDQEAPQLEGMPSNAATAKTIMAVKKQLSYELTQDRPLCRCCRHAPISALSSPGSGTTLTTRYVLRPDVRGLGRLEAAKFPFLCGLGDRPGIHSREAPLVLFSHLLGQHQRLQMWSGCPGFGETRPQCGADVHWLVEVALGSHSTPLTCKQCMPIISPSSTRRSGSTKKKCGSRSSSPTDA